MAFRLVLVIEGPGASPDDVSTRVIKCCERLVYRFVALQGRVLRLEQHIIPTLGTVMSMRSKWDGYGATARSENIH